jgi:hypothetical protein
MNLNNKFILEIRALSMQTRQKKILGGVANGFYQLLAGPVVDFLLLLFYGLGGQKFQKLNMLQQLLLWHRH